MRLSPPNRRLRWYILRFRVCQRLTKSFKTRYHNRHATMGESKALIDDLFTLLGVRPKYPRSLLDRSPIDLRPTLYENRTINLKTCHREGNLVKTSFLGSQTDDLTRVHEQEASVNASIFK